LMDAWVLDRGQIRDIRERLGVPCANWMPVDVAKLSAADDSYLKESGAFPIAMSRHGHRELQKAGFTSAAYVPHGVDTSIFRPLENRAELRRRFNVAGRFVLGVNSALKEQVRKSYGETFEAFRRFCKRHPEADALLSVNAVKTAPGALNLPRMAERKGIADRVAYNDQYAYLTGGIGQPALNEWYNSIDALCIVSYGEGFGIPILESQAAGTPVIVNDASAMTELCNSGWMSRNQPFWNEHHGEDWAVPLIDSIVKAMEKAYDHYLSNQRDPSASPKRKAARAFALQYDADLVTETYWKPVLAELEAMTRRHGKRRAHDLDAERDAATDALGQAWTAGLLDADETADGVRKVLGAATAQEISAAAVVPEREGAAA